MCIDKFYKFDVMYAKRVLNGIPPCQGGGLSLPSCDPKCIPGIICDWSHDSVTQSKGGTFVMTYPFGSVTVYLFWSNKPFLNIELRTARYFKRTFAIERPPRIIYVTTRTFLALNGSHVASFITEMPHVAPFITEMPFGPVTCLEQFVLSIRKCVLSMEKSNFKNI